MINAPRARSARTAVCTPVEPPIHALLFRKDGGSTAFIPFYFHNRGNPGHRVVAPFYWHFWGPEGSSRVFAPFYWRFTDYALQRVVTVIPPYSHTIQPGAESWAVWPLFYKSTKFGWAAPLLLSFKVDDPEQQKSYGLYALLYFWKRDERAGTSFDLLLPLFASSRSRDSAFTWVLPLNFYWRTGDAKTPAGPAAVHWATPDAHPGHAARYHTARGTTGLDRPAVLVRRRHGELRRRFPLVWSSARRSAPRSSRFAHLRRRPEP